MPRAMFDPTPLVRQVQLSIREEVNDDALLVVGASTNRIAEVLNVSSRAVKRWKAGAKITRKMADEMSLRVGLMPELLWDDWLA